MKKRLLCTIICALLVVSMAVPALAGSDRGWESAYRSVISSEAEKYGGELQLVDLDLDGTPELMLGYAIGSGLFSTCKAVYTYKSGAAVEVVTDEFMLSTEGYTLYRNDITGECRIEGGYTFRTGTGYYANITGLYSLQQSAFKRTFCKSVAGSNTSYYLESDVDVSENFYTEAYNNRNSGWTQIGDFGTSSVYYSSKTPSSSDLATLFGEYEDGGAVLSLVSTHKVSVDGITRSAAAYNINGSNYFKLRDIAYILSGTNCTFEVEWNDSLKSINITTGKSYTAVGGELGEIGSVSKLGTPTTAKLYVDGKQVEPDAYNISGNNYYKIRDIADIIGFGIDWDQTSNTVLISTK